MISSSNARNVEWNGWQTTTAQYQTRASVTVRHAERNDAEAIAAVHNASFVSTYPGMVPDALLEDFKAQDIVNDWRKALSHDNPPIWVAEYNGRIVGFVKACEAEDQPGTGEIFLMYMHPDYAGKGIGHVLLDIVLGSMRNRYAKIVLWVLAENANARAFYERVGFSADHIERERLKDYPVKLVRYSFS